MMNIVPVPEGASQSPPGDWTTEDWQAFYKSSLFDRPDVPKENMKLKTWWYVLPGQGNLYLAQAKFVTDSFAILYAGTAGRVFFAKFTGKTWIV